MANQREATVKAVMSVIKESGVKWEPGQDVRPLMTKEMRAQVNEILFAGFRAGAIDLKVEKTDAELKSYVSGLQTNWLNKAKELNGGVQHVTKNPGSRSGTTDPQIKALRGLLSRATTSDEKAEIQGYIDARLEAIGKSKSKTVTINYDDLPEELRSKYVTEVTPEETSDDLADEME